jgi:Domain of unknown function (DUF4136)
VAVANRNGLARAFSSFNARLFRGPGFADCREMRRTILTCVVLLVANAPQFGQAKYGVTVTKTNDVDFSKLQTYSWSWGKPSHNKEIDSWIVAAIDREMTGVGLRKNTAVLGDVIVTYDSISRTDSDEPGVSEETTTQPQRWVGSLAVNVLDSGNRRRPFVRLALAKPIDVDPSQLHAEIDLAVRELFEKYPVKREK